MQAVHDLLRNIARHDVATPAIGPRHCEELTGPREVARPDDRLRDEAIQNCAAALDCFAELVIGPALRAGPVGPQ
jgi:hypothetical protein